MSDLTPTRLLTGKYEPLLLDILEEHRRRLEEENGFEYWEDVDVTCHATPGTEFPVEANNFARTPTGYLVIKKDRAVDVYTGATAWSVNKLYLKASVASAVITVRIFK